jgi:hypothetical protein
MPPSLPSLDIDPSLLLLRAIHVFPVLKVAISVRSMVVLKLTLKFGLVGGCGA